MKLIRQIFLLCAMPLFFFSCEKDGDTITASGGSAGTLKASSTSLVLEKVNQTKEAIALNWDIADFGYQASITQVLQIGIKGNSFANARELALDIKTTTRTFTVLEFNDLVLKLGIPFGKSTDIEARIKSQISNDVAPVYSNVISLSVTPYELVSWIYAPGDYQGWLPPSADSLISATGNGVYTGIIYFPAKAGASFEFKLTPEKDWDLAYGDGGNGTLSTSGGNLKAPGAGSYRITADLNEKTWKMEVSSWGLIGDATPGGWDKDTDLIYNNGSAEWVLTVALKAGEIKFRYNDDWGLNLGGSGTEGLLKEGGDNIKITSAGTYKIVLNVSEKKFTLQKI